MKNISIQHVWPILLILTLLSGQIKDTGAYRNKIIQATRLSNGKIRLDGKLTESAWQQTPAGDRFLQRSPDDGYEPTCQTRFSVLYDDEYLYIGVWALDPEPENISAILTRRDERAPSDWVYVSIDSYNDNRTAFEFGLSAAGVKNDLRRYDDNNRDWDWDGVWDGEVNINETGWTAEFRIPFRELRFKTSEIMEWGFMVYREYPRNNNELSVWNYWSQDEAGFVSNYGKLTGLKNIKSKKPLYISPYVVGQSRINDELRTSVHPKNYDLSANVGADVRYSFANGLTLNGTVNPDFGQVEADPAEFNLTEFETYFSEKRPFFMEGGNILNFNLGFGDGDIGNNTLFYSRRIGRSPHNSVYASGDAVSVKNPELTQILSALKLTGKTQNGFSLGVMSALTNEEKATIYYDDGTTESEIVEPMTNYFLLRMQQDYRDGQTVVGGIVTSTNRRLDNTGMDYLHESAYTGGFDLSHEFVDRKYFILSGLAFSRVEGSSDAILQTQMSSSRYYQRPDADHLSLDENATSLQGFSGKFIIGKSRGNVIGAFGITTTSPGFEVNDLGFMQNADNFMQFIWLGYRSWTPGKIFQSFQMNTNQWIGGNYAPEITDRGGNFNFNGTFLNNWQVGTGINFNLPGISVTTLRGGPSVYKSASSNFWYYISTDWRKTISYNISGGIWGNADKARSFRLSPSFNLRPRDNLQIGVSASYNFRRETAAWRGKGWDADDNIHYLFSKLEQKTLSFTVRVNYTITNVLSLQYYGQPYITAGAYSGFREADRLKEENFDLRYRKLEGAETLSDGSLDIDGNGSGDYELYNGLYSDFNYKQYRSNLVLRWEFKTGSSLYLVWSQGFTDYESEGNFSFGDDMERLFDTPGDNILLIKLSYLLNI